MVHLATWISVLSAIHVHGRPLAPPGFSFAPAHHDSVSQVTLKAPSTAISFQHEEEIKYELEGVPFFSPNIRSGLSFVSLLHTPDEVLPLAYTPVTLVSLPAAELTGEDLSVIIQGYLDSDDVFSKAWLSTVILRTGDETTLADLSLSAVDQAQLREEFGIERILVEHHVRLDQAHSPDIHIEAIGPLGNIDYAGLNSIGPFLAMRDGDTFAKLLPVFRLHSDIYRTFIVGMYPNLEGSYRELRMVDAKGYYYIPVPSRLYSHCKEDNGVCGARIGVKDLYDVQGVTTAAGSRIWGEFKGKASKTASSVQRLVDLGGILVGKTKTASFAAGGEGHEESVDEQYPFSARGDLWQTCLGSSSGSACAMGAYDWLDIGLGSDTGGSVRAPAAVVGLYGNRPSHGAIDLDGVIPQVDYSDSAGVMVRAPGRFSSIMRSWYAGSPLNFQEYPRLPQRIILDTGFGGNHTDAALEITNSFLAAVKSDLGMEIGRVDIDASLATWNWTWERVEDELYDDSYKWLSWDQNGTPLYSDYAARHDGRSPPTDPVIRDWWREARDRNMSRED